MAGITKIIQVSDVAQLQLLPIVNSIFKIDIWGKIYTYCLQLH